MTTYTFLCVSGESETELRIVENLVGIEWECLGGENVWGSPWRAKEFGPKIGKGNIALGIDDVLNDVEKIEKGTMGTGYHSGQNGGNFPEGEFNWKITQVM